MWHVGTVRACPTVGVSLNNVISTVIDVKLVGVMLCCNITELF